MFGVQAVFGDHSAGSIGHCRAHDERAGTRAVLHTGLSRIVRFWIRGLPALSSNTGRHTLLLRGVGLTGKRTTTSSTLRFRTGEYGR